MRGRGSFKGGLVSLQCATIKLWMHVGTVVMCEKACELLEFELV